MVSFNRSIVAPALAILSSLRKITPTAPVIAAPAPTPAVAVKNYLYYLTAQGVTSRKPSTPVLKTIKAPNIAAAKAMA